MNQDVLHNGKPESPEKSYKSAEGVFPRQRLPDSRPRKAHWKENQKTIMTFKTSACTIMAFSLLALCSPAILLPTEHLGQELSHENDPERVLAAKNRERCPGKLSSRFPHSARIDLRAIDVGAEDRMLTDISSRSLTPWDYSVDKDVNRYPEVIVQANCLHSMCLDSEGQKDPRLNSIPIMHQILVLRREQKGCSQNYKLEKQWVTFGCTCVRPAISYVSY